MAELTQENFHRLANDVTALDKTLGELKGSIDGLKHSHNVLVGCAALVGGLFLAALLYLGSQVGGLDTRVDGVITALGSVQGELRAINQRLMVLEDIRDRIEELAFADPAPAAGQTIPTDEPAPHIASENGVVLAGDIDPAGFAAVLKTLSENLASVQMVGINAPENETRIIYSTVSGNAIQRLGQDVSAQGGFEKSEDIHQFTASVEKYRDEHPVGGVLLISTSDPQLRDIAAGYGVDFDR
jgi:hypothetical protein